MSPAPSRTSKESSLADLERAGHPELDVPRDVAHVLVLASLLEGDLQGHRLAGPDDLGRLDTLDVEVVQSGTLVHELEDDGDAVLDAGSRRELEVEVRGSDGDRLDLGRAGRRRAEAGEDATEDD